MAFRIWSGFSTVSLLGGRFDRQRNATRVFQLTQELLFMCKYTHNLCFVCQAVCNESKFRKVMLALAVFALAVFAVC
jgi:hypothetical protein